MSQTLLLADDSVTIQRVIELTFADEDITVTAVGDGVQAIERITADPPDIVLADTDMPKKDGYEVAAFIKGDAALAHIPVVLLTGAFEPVDGNRAREIGCDAVLVKPFDPQRVISRVQELLGGRRAPAGFPASEPVDSPADKDEKELPIPSAEASHVDSHRATNAPLAGGVSSPGVEAMADAKSEIESLDATVSALDTLTSDGADSEDGAVGERDSALPSRDGSASPPVGTTVSSVDRGRTVSVPTLADAFASLLAAEQGTVDELRTIHRPPRSAVLGISEELIDRVTDRVVERLSDTLTGEIVADIVSRVAERLVREEIDRFKQA